MMRILVLDGLDCALLFVFSHYEMILATLLCFAAISKVMIACYDALRE